jgi:GH24 family phage-related lysozyme (muramidase)
MDFNDWVRGIFTSPTPATIQPTPTPGAPTMAFDYVTPLETLLKLREGCRNDVYPDKLGKPTVGIGHLVTPDDNLSIGDIVSDEFVDAWFKKDSLGALHAAIGQAKQAGIAEPMFVVALASVCFQMGDSWTKVFPNTWALICRGQYEEAARALTTSLWARQTPIRVKDFKDALRALPPKIA